MPWRTVNSKQPSPWPSNEMWMFWVSLVRFTSLEERGGDKLDIVPTCGDCCWSMNCLELYAKRVYIISSCFLDQTIYLVWNMNILFGYLLSRYTKIENIDQIKITERRLLVSNMRNNSKRKYIFGEKSKPEGEKVSKLPTIIKKFLL